MTLMFQFFGFVLCAIIGLLGFTIIVWIWLGKIDLSALISEPSGQASLSRFQLLIFTFVIAISLFALVEKGANPTGFPDIPGGVLTLLGISASTYAVSKGITYSQPEVLMKTATSQSSGDPDTAGAQAAATQAAESAAAAQQAVAATQAAVGQAAAHAASAQQAAQQTAQQVAAETDRVQQVVIKQASPDSNETSEQTTVTQVTVAQTTQG